MTSVAEDKDQIRELLASYCYYYDDAQFDRWRALWTDDSEFDVDGNLLRGPGWRDKFTGAAVLVNGKPQMKHYVMNEIISVSGDTATASCYLLVVRKLADGSLITGTAGTYEDKLVKKNGRWLFAFRRCRRDLRHEQVLVQEKKA